MTLTLAACVPTEQPVPYPPSRQWLQPSKLVNQVQGKGSYFSIDAEGVAGPASTIHFYIKPPKQFHIIQAPVADPSYESSGSAMAPLCGQLKPGTLKSSRSLMPKHSKKTACRPKWLKWLRLSEADISAKFTHQVSVAATKWQPQHGCLVAEPDAKSQCRYPDIKIIELILDSDLHTIGMQTIDNNGVIIRMVLTN